MPTETPARLILANGREIELTGSMTIGRSVENWIKLDGEAVSRKHANLEMLNGRFVLHDLSSNGTFVNEKRITGPTELRDGDKVRIGSNVLIFKKGLAPIQSTLNWQTTEPLSLVRGDGAEFGVNRGMIIGRSDKCDLVLVNDNSASQTHAKIDLVAGQAIVTDLTSRNGTWVNGKKISGATRLKHADKVLVGDTIFRLRVGSRLLPATETPQRPNTALGVGLFVGGGLLTLLVVGLLGFGILALGGLWYFLGRGTPTPAVAVEVVTQVAPVQGPTQQAEAEQAALRALVLVVSPIGSANSSDTSSGSGSLINAEGYVLTNFHVIGDLRSGNFYNRQGWVLVGMNWNNVAAAPDTFYRAEITNGDPRIDLALLHIVGLENGDPLPTGQVFPYVPAGNSDNLKIGDPIAVIGYPGLGGDTPTLTRGTVSGFLVDADNNLNTGWIKTDAEINPGNSGGMAINANGELIGIPTQAFTGTDVTGKISEIRPINIALKFIRGE
jgi:pSer/pThr/pTyr-binding forkhead associated (FHA) protein/S1-C subfamily serine protease